MRYVKRNEVEGCVNKRRECSVAGGVRRRASRYGVVEAGWARICKGFRWRGQARICKMLWKKDEGGQGLKEPGINSGC